MRRFKTTPQKKLAGMLILFVFIPLFLLWYGIFFLDNKPSPETLVIIVAVAVLGAYFYLRYKKQIQAIAAGQLPAQPADKFAETNESAEEELLEEDESDEAPVEEELNESDELAEGPVPKPKQK